MTHGTSIKKISLKQALELLDRHNIELSHSRLDINYSETIGKKIAAQYAPKLNVLLGVGPINKAYGDALQSSDADIVNFKSWGVLAMATVQAYVPLYTWGQKGNYLKAAALGKKVKEKDLVIKKNSLRYKLKEIYYGNLLAANILDFIDGIEEDMDTALKELKKKKKNRDSLYQLKIFKYQLLATKHEVQSKYDLSQKALAYYIGEEGSSLVKPQEEWLEFNKKKLKPFKYYKELFLDKRPELVQLKAGIAAKSLLAKATNKKRYPMLGLLGKYDFSYTSARQKQESVFAYDPYNKNSMVVGLGLTWDLDWGVASVETQQYNIERMQLEVKQRQANIGLLLELEKAWEEVKVGAKIVKNSSKSRRYAKKWLNRIIMKSGIGGEFDMEQFAKAYQSRAMTFQSYLESLYAYYLAWAKLSETVGVEVDPSLVNEL